MITYFSEHLFKILVNDIWKLVRKKTLYDDNTLFSNIIIARYATDIKF